MRNFVIAAAATLAFAPALAQAQQTKPAAPRPSDAQAATEPVVVVSITSLERLTSDVNYVTGALGQAQAGSIFGMMANTYTNGIDRSRPSGVAMMMQDGTPAALVFVPTTDVKRILKTFEPQTGPPDEFDDGTLAVAAGASILYVRQQGDWAFAAQSREMLATLPDDPTAWLQGMGDDYDLGVRVNVQALSPEQRQMVTSQIRQGFEQAMDAQPAAQAEQMRRMGAQSLEQLELMINDTETLQLGLAIQQDARQIKFEVLVTAAPGTEMATIFAAQQAIPSKFASLIQPDKAAYFHSATSIGPQGIEQARTSLEQATESVKAALESSDDLSAEERAEFESFFERLIEIGVATIQEGKSDTGGLLSLENQQLNAVAGFFVSDGAKVAQLVKDLAAKVESSGDPNAPTFTFDAADYNGVSLHYVDAAVPEDKAPARQIFGEKLRLTIGTGPDAVYLALGKNSEAMLKELIDSAASDQGGDERPLGQGQVRLMPILEFAQSVNANESLAAMIDSLARAGDSDKVGFVSRSIERGSRTEMTIGEGILRAAGAAITSQQQQQQQQQLQGRQR